MANPVGAGVILVRVEHGKEPRFLLLRGRETHIWSFSKGHPEHADGRSLIQTAIRETREETGFESERDYFLLPIGPIRFGKRPYWVGVMTAASAPNVRLSRREHDVGGWFTWAEVSALRSNVDVRTWVRKTALQNNPFGEAIKSLSEPVAA